MNELKTPKSAKKQLLAERSPIENMLCTPKKQEYITGSSVEKTPSAKALEQQTPRRSARKSIKPMQDYNEIVGRRLLRSDAIGELQESNENEEPKARWSTALVGKTSEKRQKKGRRNIGKKKQNEVMIEAATAVENIQQEEESASDSKQQETDLLQKTGQLSPSEMSIDTETAAEAQKSDAELLQQPSSADVPETEQTAAEEMPNASIVAGHIHYEKESVIDSKPEATDLLQKASTADASVGHLPSSEISIDTETAAEAQKSDAELLQQASSAHVPETEQTAAEEMPNAGIVAENIHHEKESVIDSKPEETDLLQETKIADASAEQLSTAAITIDFETAAEEQKSDAKLLHDEPGNITVFFNENKADQEPEKEINCAADISGLQQINETAEKESLSMLQADENIAENSCNMTDSENVISLNDTFEVIEIEETPCVKKEERKSSAGYRFPTPFKIKLKTNFQHLQTSPASSEDKFSFAEPIPVIIIDDTPAANNQLRSIRKRSISLTIDEPSKRKQSRVTFYSPANETILIESSAAACESKPNKMNILHKQPTETKKLDASYVTNRRQRRSKSLDNSILNRLPNPQQMLALKSTPQKQAFRTKLPNFAAIHQRQFKNMENIVDHVARKAERAKVLHSAGKPRIASAQKAAAPKRAFEMHEKPKAMRKIKVIGDLSKIPKATFGSSPLLSKLDIKEKTAEKCNQQKTALEMHEKPKGMQKIQVIGDLSKIPKATLGSNLLLPKLDIKEKTAEKCNQQKTAPTATIKPPTFAGLQTSVNSKSAISKATPTKQQPFKLTTAQPQKLQTAGLNKTLNMLPSTSQQAFKPAFNLSTAVLPSVSINAVKPAEDKTVARRQRHMQMYKGRTAAETRTAAPEAARQILKGVRTNRRFELQMAHRRNLEEE